MADAQSEQFVYLHGDLDLHVIEARRFSNMDIVSERFRRCFTACDTINCSSCSHSGVKAEDRKIRHHRKIITRDSYISVVVPQATVARTCVIKNSQSPQWRERFVIQFAHPVVNLEFQVKDNDVFGAELIGTATKIASGEFIFGWFLIYGATGKLSKPDCAINFELKFTAFDRNSVYKRGIAGNREHKGATYTYFPLRKGSSVRLYQDAHVPKALLPQIELDGRNLWDGLFFTMS